MSGNEIAIVKGLLDLTITAAKEGWFEKLGNLFRKRHRILVLGATGTGKTQLIKSLTTLVPEAISYMKRTQLIEYNKIKIDKKLFDFIEAPGDLTKKDIRQTAYKEAIKIGVDAVMNVVAYGYHEYRVGEMNDVFTPKGNIRKKFLEVHRQAEIDMLHEWDKLILGDEVTKTMLTVVTKADIWWNNRHKVIDYYESGPYFRSLNTVPVHHAVVSYCSRKHKMFDRGQLSNEFDDNDLIELRAFLFESILAAIGREQ